MSSRTKKSTTTNVTSTSNKSTGSGTPGRAATGTPGRSALTPGRLSGTPGSARPPSPTMISRMAEKNELASLNDRLASYIDRVRQLEGENSRLTRMIQTQEDNVSKEVVNIKGMYDNELSQARRLLDDLAKEKARLLLENTNLKSELTETNDKLKQIDKELLGSEKRVLSAEAQVNDLQAKLNDALNQRRFWEDEYNKLQRELETLNKSLINVRKSLEEETIRRVDAENRAQSLREELVFKTQLHQQELSESAHRSRIVLEETRLETDYDSRLREALAEIRRENEEQINQMREETESTLEKKMLELRDAAGRADGEKERALSELRSVKKRIDELTNQISHLNCQNTGYETRVRDLESQLKRVIDEGELMNESLNSEIRRLKGSLEAQLQEYRDLMDVKIQLDTEISAYRKLLETEETRLNITSSSVDPGSAGRLMNGEKSRKRARVEQSEVIEISHVTDKYITLSNTSMDKDVSLAGWVLKQEGGLSETMYKFQRSVVLKAQQQLNVWSSDSDGTHSPPSDFVMKGQSWYTADNMRTSLLDNKGEEQSWNEMRGGTRVSVTHNNGSSVTDTENAGAEARSKSKWGWSLFGQ